MGLLERAALPWCSWSMRYFLAIALVLTACSDASSLARATDGPPRKDDSGPVASPPAPTPGEWSAQARTTCATALVRTLVEAVNLGDRSALERTFRPGEAEHPFQWVSMPQPSGHWVSYGAPGAVATLLERQRAGERWELVWLTSGSGPSWHGGVDFSVRLTRTAPDLAASMTGTGIGKGAGSCASGRIYVLSLGTD